VPLILLFLPKEKSKSEPGPLHENDAAKFAPPAPNARQDSNKVRGKNEMTQEKTK
jgi:hypothetical protein